MKALEPTEVPVPRVFVLCTDVDVIGTPFYIMDFVKGRVFTDPSLPSVPPKQRMAYYHSLLRTLVALHSVSPSAVGLDGFGKHGKYFRRQLRTFTHVAYAQQEFAGPLPGTARAQRACCCHLCSPRFLAWFWA